MASSTKSPSEAERLIACGGECGRTATILDPARAERPLTKLAVGLVGWLELLLVENFEFDAAANAWFCVHCRRRRRLVKLLH